MCDICDKISEVKAAIEVMTYLKRRAEIEKAEFELTPHWLLSQLAAHGASIFDATMFGVRVNRDGAIISDEQESHPGFLDDWRSNHANWWARAGETRQ